MNSLNLKKKIAFISSLAMLAATAAYLPADIAKQVGFGSSIVSAATGDGTDQEVDTMKLYVKIDGKYLAYSSNDGYKLFDTVKAAEETKDSRDTLFAPVEINDASLAAPGMTGVKTLKVTDTADKFFDSFAVDTDSTATDATGTSGKGEVFIPYELVTGNSVISVEAVAEEGASIKSSYNTVEASLDGKGMAKVAKKTKPIVAQNDYSKKDNTGVYTAGSYEEVDLSGLIFRVKPQEALSGLTLPATGAVTKVNGKSTGTDVSEQASVGISQADGIVNSNKYNLFDKKDAVTADYPVKKFGDVYATVLTASLVKEVAPGTVITLETGLKTNWTMTGAGVNKSEITLTMGDDGVAESGLLAVKKNDTVEYYVIVLNNATNIWDAANDTCIGNIKLSTDGAGSILYGSAGSGVKLNAAPAYNAPVKIERKLVAENVPGAGKQYVEVFTVYNNETLSSGKKQQIELSVDKVTTSNNIFYDDTTYATYIDLPGVSEAADKGGTGTPQNGKYYKDDGVGTVVIGDTTQGNATNGAGFKYTDAVFTTTTPGCFETPVLSVVNRKTSASPKTLGYFKIVFTNKYEIELDDANEKTEEDGKTSVEGKTVTKPDAPTKNGFTFDGWYLTSNGTAIDEDKPVYTVAGKNLQQNKDDVTPNQKLVANWKGNKYNVVYDANGGSITADNEVGLTVNDVDEDSNILSASKQYTAGDKQGASPSDGGIYAANAVYEIEDALSGKDSAVAGSKYGYDFIGWALTADATEALTDEEIDSLRPAAVNDTVKLYAVYEARTYAITFGSVGLKDGVPVSTTLELSDDQYATKLGSAFKTGAGYAPSFEKAIDGFKEVKTGEKLGTLPTPVLKGYTFDGWYIAKPNADTGTVTAQKVTSNTVLSDNVFDKSLTDNANFGKPVAASNSATVTLYAKFKQNTYNVTFDLDGGEFATSADDAAKPVTYKYSSTDMSAGTASWYNKLGGSAAAFKEEPKLGSGDFYAFKGWSINGSTSVVSAANLLTHIEKNVAAGDLTIKAVYQKKTNELGSVFFNKNGGDFYSVTKSTSDSSKEWDTAKHAPKTLSLATSPSAKGLSTAKVSTVLTIKDNIIEEVADAGKYYVVARPGYTFTGWYTDKECTKAYTFGNFPDKTEVTLYAGWKANTTTRYEIKYNLIDSDGSIVTPGKDDGDALKNDPDYTFHKTFMGTTGSEVKASDRTFTYNGKTFVFDAKLSSGANTTDIVRAGFVPGEDKYSDDNSTMSGAPNGVINTGDVDGIAFANFILTNANNRFKDEDDNYNYTILEATFTEESAVSKELGTVDDVKVDAEGKVTWSAVDNAVKYKVVKKVNGKTYYGKETTETSYKFDNVPATEYSVRVVAFDKDGNKTWGKEITIAPAETNVLGKVKNIKVAADRKSVTWDAADNAVSYKVVKKIGDKTYYTSEITDTSYTFGSATQGEFSVKVVAFDAYGEKTWSDEYKVAAAPVASLGSVGNVKVGTDNKTLTWSAVDNAVSYRVAKIVGGKTYYTAKTTKLTTTLGSALKEGNKVYLIAYDKNGKSVTGPQTKISSVAKATKVAVAADGKTVTWTAAKNAAQYQVAKLINGKTYYGTKVDAKTTKYTFGSAATAGTQVFVITFDADGNSSYSDAVLVK